MMQPPLEFPIQAAVLTALFSPGCSGPSSPLHLTPPRLLPATPGEPLLPYTS